MSVTEGRTSQENIAQTGAERRLSASALITLLLGAAGLALVTVGTFLVIVLRGLVPYERVVEGLLSSETLWILITSLVLGAVAIVGGFGRYGRMPTKRSREQAIAGAVLGIQAVVLAAVLLLFREVGDPDRFVFHFFNIEFLQGSGGVFVRAARNTLILALVGELGGIVLGLLLAMLVLSKRAVVRAPARLYINFFRGTPLIWQLSVFYFGLSLGLGIRPEIALGPIEFGPAYVSAMIVFILNTGAYASEVFRAGIQSIERGQMEAARSLGMTYPQAMRHAIVPQAFRRVIPPLMNEFVILIKDTSLIVVLGLAGSEFDLFTQAREGYATTFNATFFTAAAVGYLAVTLPLIRAVNAVEKRLRSGLVTVTS
jgi:His/Glu/Gln/Arg/opine family amino acid ABC transporter permease subunit